MPVVDCYVQDLSRTYANGLPRVEVFVRTECVNLVANPACRDPAGQWCISVPEPAFTIRGLWEHVDTDLTSWT